MPRRRKTEARRRTKPPGIREIAQTLGISIGTVDRALHDRPGINQATRAKVLESAKSLGYRPNLAARVLSSRKQFRVGVNLPREIASFFDLVRDGILDVARSLPVDSPMAAGATLLGLVDAFRRGEPVRDDETLIVIKRA